MKQEINVPTNLSEINLQQYQAFLKIQDENDSQEFIAQKMVSIFCMIKLSQVLYINVKSITEIVSSLTAMFDTDKKLIKTFEIGGKKFGFIPSLEDMSFGEYIDLETNIIDWQNIHKAMAVLFRPITKETKHGYEIESYEGTANYSDVMKFMPLDVAFGAVVFFCNLEKDLLKATLNFIVEEVEEMSSAKSINLDSNGDGINQSMPSLEVMLDSLKMLQDFQYSNV